jgi:bifunctional non-homologous end joining protein LigD
VRRLALHVEDHNLAFGDFEGEIPDGQYGAGTVEIWDRGSYTLHKWTDDRIEVTLEGRRVKGRYCLTRFHRKGQREWLLWRSDG